MIRRKQPQTPTLRCVEEGCGALSKTLIGGRCPRCEAVRHAIANSHWEPQTQLVRLYQRADGRALGCVAQRLSDRWTISAFEAQSNAGMQGVLDDHAHQILGTYNGITVALEAAESFAASWLKRGKNLIACECPAIEELQQGRSKKTPKTKTAEKVTRTRRGR